MKRGLKETHWKNSKWIIKFYSMKRGLKVQNSYCISCCNWIIKLDEKRIERLGGRGGDNFAKSLARWKEDWKRTNHQITKEKMSYTTRWKEDWKIFPDINHSPCIVKPRWKEDWKWIFSGSLSSSSDSFNSMKRGLKGCKP